MFFALSVHASSFTDSYVRLDRNKASTTLSGTACATPSSSGAGTEAKVVIDFPSDFTINSNTSNWSVSTSNLPAGAVAWPGIGVSQVTNNSIIFTSSDLSTSSLYCFNFSSGSSTTGSAGNNKAGNLATRNSSNTTIDTVPIAFSIVSDDQISVTATVPANPTDFSVNLEKTDPSNSLFPENTTISYKITYGSNLSYASNITLEAQWYQGTLSGQGSPSVDIVSYVVGSAGSAYASTAPVIDTVNNKITWTISSFPANTSGQTVSFKLETENYTGSSAITFPVKARIIGPGNVSTADSTVSLTYQNSSQSSPTSTPTSTPGPTSTPAPGATNTPTPKPATTATPTPTPKVKLTPTPTPKTKTKLSFQDITVRSVLATNASIGITTTNSTGVVLNYGTSINNLGGKTTDPAFSTSRIIFLSALSPDTEYYFKVRAIDKSGGTIDSDIFTFKTALPSLAPEIDFQTLVVTSSNTILVSNLSPDTGSTGAATTGDDPSNKIAENKPIMVLPISTPYQFRFSLQGRQVVKRIKAILRNKKVLGVSSAEASNDNSANVEIQEVQTGVYAGRLLGQPIPGIYELFIQIYDNNGNVAEQKIGEIRIVKPFGIFDKSTHQPVENATVLFYFYNPSSRIYSIISSDVIGVKNPSNSLYDGTVPIVLAEGKYKVQINALGYPLTNVEFVIGAKENQNYPQIYLDKQPFNIITTIIYYAGTAYDVFNSTVVFVKDISKSIRFFDLVALVSLTLLVTISIFSFSVRTHIPLQHLPLFFLFNAEDTLFRRTHERYVHGEVKDQHGGRAVSRATVKLYDAKSNTLLAQTSTNKIGEFYMRKPQAAKYKIVISKNDYEGFTIPDYLPNALIGKLEYIIKKIEDNPIPSFSRLVLGGAENFIGFLFEFIILICIFLELIFAQSIGLLRALPFIGITVVTIIMWLAYAKRILRKTIGAAY